MSEAAEQLQYWAAEAAWHAALQRKRPFMLIRPRLFPDGDQWCALYGDNLQDGVCAFGDTPDAASINFDLAWLNERCAARRESTAAESGRG